MRLPRIAIDNYQFTIVVTGLLLMLGVTSFLTMPRTEDPPLQLPGASVILVYPGGNPLDLEQLIVTPVEESLNELDDIKRMVTTVRDGIVITNVEFTFGTDADEKFDEVVQQVNSIRSELPGDLYGLEIMQWSSSDVVIMQLALVSETTPYSELGEYAEELKKDLEKVYGVKEIEILALPEQEVRVSLDMVKMAQMNISLDMVGNAILSNNANIPGGNIKIGEKDFGIKTSGSYSELEEIRRTVVSSYNGRLIYLENIASVDFGYEDITYKARYEGERCIFLSVKQKAGYNIYTINEGIQPVLEEHAALLDNQTELITVFDQTGSVDSRINSFLSNLLQGILLVGIVIILALGARASVIVIFAIPFSILIGLGFVDTAGFGLQQISIAGLVISLGLLVDNSIVIVENIERFIGLGYSRREAAIRGSAQIGWPIVSATATTMLAFIPIITMPDKAGKFIQSMPVTVIFTLLASLFIALTITPYIASVVLKANSKESGKKLRGWLRNIIEGPYRRTLQYSLRKTWLVILLAVLALGGAGALFRLVGVSFFPKAEKPQFMIRITAPEGSTLDKTDRVARYVESVLDTLPGVKHYAANIGHGNPRIYYNIFPKRDDKNFAELFVEMESYEVEQFDATVSGLRRFFAGYPGARIEIKEFEQGSPIEAPLTIKITGKEIPVLKRIAADVEGFVHEVKGPVNIDNALNRVGMDLYFNINRDKAGMLGVPVSEIDKTIRTAITGMPVSTYRDPQGKEYSIVLRLPYRERIRLEDLDEIYVTSVTGRSIPLRQLAGIELREAPGMLTHFDMDRNATITADIRKGFLLDDIVVELEEKLQAYPWPAGYDYKFTGELESREESFGGIFRASIIALIAIFAVLVLQFRSFTQPLIIYTAIPLAGIGSAIALFVTGYSFSFTAGIGMISLIGVVINNSIILVDYANKLIAEGKERVAALVEAGETRFTPIVLTTLTTIGGLLPLTLRGGTLWAPMGWTIIGGLLVSTFLTLLVVPVLYKLYAR